MMMILKAIFLSLIVLNRLVYMRELSDGAILMSLTKDIAERFYRCELQMDLDDYALDDLSNFWEPFYNMENHGTGCAIFCIVYGLWFVNDTGHLQPQNAEGYLRAHGADTTLVDKLFNVAYQCKDQIISRNITDVCTIALEAGTCFRTGLFELDLMPDEDDYRRSEMDDEQPPRCRRSFNGTAEIDSTEVTVNDTDNDTIKANATFYTKLKGYLGLV